MSRNTEVMQHLDQTDLSLVPTGTSRRSVLAAAAAVGAIGVVGACGGGEPTATTDTSSDPSASSSSTPAGSGDALTSTAGVPVGGGVILDKQKVVVTQPVEGTFKAFTAICTHQNCTVSSVEEGAIICACHHSAFSVTDGSTMVNPLTGKKGPAPQPLAEVPVTVEGGQVVES